MPFGGTLSQLALALLMGIVGAFRSDHTNLQAAALGAKASFIFGTAFMLFSEKRWWPSNVQHGRARNLGPERLARRLARILGYHSDKKAIVRILRNQVAPCAQLVPSPSWGPSSCSKRGGKIDRLELQATPN